MIITVEFDLEEFKVVLRSMDYYAHSDECDIDDLYYMAKITGRVEKQFKKRFGEDK